MRAYRATFSGKVRSSTYPHRRCGICRGRYVRGIGTKRNRIGWRKEIVLA